MVKKNKIAIFEGQKIRRLWDDKTEKWYFSVVDAVAVLTKSINARSYWKVLKSRLKEEGSEVVTKCNQLKIGKWAERVGRLSELPSGNWSQI